MKTPESTIDLLSQNYCMPIIDLKISGMVPVIPGHIYLKFEWEGNFISYVVFNLQFLQYQEPASFKKLIP